MVSQVTPKSLKNSKLFQPIKVGKNEFSNRVVFAPSTRFRAAQDHTPSDLQLQYYDDRTKYPGTLIITEGTVPNEKTGTYAGVPGIFTENHIKGWKKINDKIHENKSFSSIQLWGLGRAADPAQNKKEGQKYQAPSPIYQDEEAEKAAKEAGNELVAYTTEEVDQLFEEYVKTARNAIAAGFDYVELHGAHGYLLNQFFEASSNQRTDKYGGSIENRARFPLALVDRLTEEIGAERLAIRISPWAKFLGMKGVDDKESHPIATYGYFLGQLQQRADAGKQLAYVSIVEPRVAGNVDVEAENIHGDNTFVKTIWKGVLVRAGNYTYDAPDFKQLLEDIDDGRTLVGFSRFFISNPDLVYRLRDGKTLTPYDRSTFYADNNWGYNTYDVSDGKQKFDEEAEKARKPTTLVA
ncbi:hypothetical protein FDK38_005309 [Candidozyma auris]|nr:hypothetical protein FDK38_005309 [[Candida] auris]